MKDYSGPSLKGHSLERTFPLERTQFVGSKFREYVMLPHTKEHLSNKDRTVLQKGCPY